MPFIALRGLTEILNKLLILQLLKGMTFLLFPTINTQIGRVILQGYITILALTKIK